MASEKTTSEIQRREHTPDQAKHRVPKLEPGMAASLREATTLKFDTSTGPSSIATETRAEPHPLYRLRLLIVLSFFIIYSSALGGIIFEREQIIAWLLITLVVANLGKTDGAAINVIRDWAPMYAVIIAYDYSRGAADTLGFPTQWNLPIAFDQAVFGGEVPTVTLQRWLDISSRTQWWEALTALVYVSHFFVPYLLLAALWQKDREMWSRYFRAFVVLSFSGIATYILLPTAPPWLASQEGLIGELTRSTNNGWHYMGLSIASQVISNGQATANDIAALPSLHAAFAALPMFMLWAKANRPSRVVLAAYPLAMAFAIVSSGEHYVFDVLTGFCYAGLSASVANRIFDRKQRRATTGVI